ncbi:hypothetical protein SAMN05444008_102361 [Cnuella takakiae]|uniref:Uncharacterized protein n=1 Tax=Cnuella takakiae TaxID=1302690 RepID=A0A1M4VS21_9BACT|nr:hypothetical protein [Cnuella takakiae]OLY92517.1 hypothetical protein BUE76_11915 [Cnuella takakiae]SHE71759.1 hypothetical protein SAMN05444008_102361 [Cnuella takakiae]
MKYLITLLLLSVCHLFANSQSDTLAVPEHDYSKDTMHITGLKLWEYGYVSDLIKSTDPQQQAYERRVATKWDGVDSNQVIKVATTYGQFIATYAFLLSKPDGIVADFNATLLQEVFPDAMRHPWIMEQIMLLRAKYAAYRQQIKEAGIKRLQEIKQSTLLDE